MADPFEVRMRFTSQLQHLNASINSAQKAAHYAIKHKDMDEDLHSCILEQLERNNLNVRANIMYFIEQLCEISQRDNHTEFIKMIRRDIYAIVDAVAPTDQGGAANVKVVRRVLGSMADKSFLERGSVSELEASLKDREVAAAEDEVEDVTMGEGPGEDSERSRGRSGKKDGGEGRTGVVEGPNGPLKLGGPGRPDKRQVEQRIEEDRERHKRLKESIWEVSGKGDDEFDKMWEEASELGDDDYIRAAEEAEERERCFDMEAKEARDYGRI